MSNLFHRYRSSPLLLAAALSLAGFRSATAQSPDVHPITSQNPVADSLAAAFGRYPTRQERLFVHIDKTVYLAGEIIWFKAYDVDAGSNTSRSLSGSNTSQSLSSIAYVELLDKDQKSILQAKIELNNGTGNGS